MAKRQYKAPDLRRLDRSLPWPRISIVTAVRNGEKYLEQTIRSVLAQQYANLEYFVVDGGSTDGTPEIIRKYESQLTGWNSEPDKGLYDALNKGFARTSGEIMGWLNAGDLLHVNGLMVVGGVFGALQRVEWITGRPTKFSEEGATIEVMSLPLWSRMRFLAGANKYIQQESTFWRRNLWERAGGRLDATLRAEGDFDLWVRFFRHAKLHSVDALIGGYRLHRDALGSSDLRRYDKDCEQIVERELRTVSGAWGVKLFRRVTQSVQSVPKVRGLWHRLAIRNLYHRLGEDAAPVIRYDVEKGWVCQ
jgi:glycosyltransferase involved in cell wall biosynthesis